MPPVKETLGTDKVRLPDSTAATPALVTTKVPESSGPWLNDATVAPPSVNDSDRCVTVIVNPSDVLVNARSAVMLCPRTEIESPVPLTETNGAPVVVLGTSAALNCTATSPLPSPNGMVWSTRLGWVLTR